MKLQKTIDDELYHPYNTVWKVYYMDNTVEPLKLSDGYYFFILETQTYMTIFDSFKSEGNNPIYIELVQFIKRQIIAHEIVNDDPLPSRREVSARLGINPNTVQKAYKLLEDEGLIESRLGAKSCVSVNEKIIRRLKKELMEAEMITMVRAMQEMGIEKNEAIELLEKVWDIREDEL